MTAMKHPAPFGTSHLLKRGRQTIEYFRRGRSDLPAVLLLAALGRSVSEFNDLSDMLLQMNFQTLAIENRGVGRSRSPIFPRASLEDLADDMIAVIEHTELSPLHLIGRALGNRIARVIAWKKPSLAKSLTLIGAGGRVARRKRIGLSYFYSNKVRNETLCAAGNQLPVALNQPPSWSALIRQLPAVKRPPKGEWWLGGVAPMLVIQGAEDQIAPPENGIELQQAAPERVKLHTLKNAGHMVLHERFTTVCELISSFLISIANKPVVQPASRSDS